jgi:large subunit ribosomal protein L3
MASSSTRRRGSRQFWPRVRAKKKIAKINSWSSVNQPKENNFLGFPTYKVGMTNIGVIDNFSHTLTKGSEINVPVTILECPVMKVLSLRLFAEDEYGNLQVVKEIETQIKDKNLSRKLDVSKKSNSNIKEEELILFAKENDVEDVRVKIMSNTSLTSTGQKKPEVLEIGVSGPIEEKIKFALSKLGEEIRVSDVFKSGDLVDSHGITTGKGFQGAVKRFGVKLTSHKSEKTRRHAGNVGAWTPSRVLTTQPLPGQHGFHQRTEWNKWIIKISDDVNLINPKEGFRHYGNVKNEYILIKGSIQGPKKRMITLVRTIRGNDRYPKIAPQITYIKK